jgi:hypothetical protein
MKYLISALLLASCAVQIGCQSRVAPEHFEPPVASTWVDREQVALIVDGLDRLQFPSSQDAVLATIPVDRPLISLPSLGHADKSRHYLDVMLTDRNASDEYFVLRMHFQREGSREALDLQDSEAVQFAEVVRCSRRLQTEEVLRARDG